MSHTHTIVRHNEFLNIEYLFQMIENEKHILTRPILIRQLSIGTRNAAHLFLIGVLIVIAWHAGPTAALLLSSSLEVLHKMMCSVHYQSLILHIQPIRKRKKKKNKNSKRIGR